MVERNLPFDESKGIACEQNITKNDRGYTDYYDCIAYWDAVEKIAETERGVKVSFDGGTSAKTVSFRGNCDTSHIGYREPGQYIFSSSPVNGHVMECEKREYNGELECRCVPRL